MRFEFLGKNFSLYSSVCKGLFNGDTMVEYWRLRYRWSTVSTGSFGNMLGGRRYNSNPLYFLIVYLDSYNVELDMN